MINLSSALRYGIVALLIAVSVTASAQTEKQIEPLLNKYKERLQFIQNKGQWRTEDLYRASTPVSTVQIMQHGFMLSVLDQARVSEAAVLDNEIEEAQAHGSAMPTRVVTIPQQAWMIEFVGMNPSVSIQNRDKQPSYYNYFLGNDKAKWASHVNSFGEVWYHNVYSKVDFRLYTGADNAVEYDVIAYPGANISAIQLKHRGLNGMYVNEKGELVAKTIFGDITYPRPVAYQTVNGKNIQVVSKYTLTDGNVLGFEVASYDPALPVVIDPVALRWAIYVSNASANGTTGHNHGIDVDPAGAIYVTGRSSATNFPTTPGVIQSTNSGSQDGFITKINQGVNVGDAGSLAWSTYIGGAGSENIYAIKLDPSGNIYITGQTAANDYPTTSGAYQTVYGGGANDAVVSKVNNTGDTLVYSTYVGGAGADQANFIYVNAAGEVFIAGNAVAGFPTTAGAYQTAFGGGAGTGDAFWSKLDASGSSLLYSTYYGGNGNDQFTCLRPSGTNDIVLIGVTTSAASIASAGAYQTARVGTNNNGMVVKFSVSPTISRTWATYINPAIAADNVTLLCQQVDNQGNVYIGGTTNGISAASLTAGAYQTTYGAGTNDLYIGKLNATGDTILYGTYVGGSGNETPIMGLNIDNFGSVYALGYTTSTNLVTTADALQSSNNGGSDAMIIKMSPDLSQIKYLSYWGGSSNDIDPVGYDGVKFSNCRFYTAITTFSNNAPMSDGAYQDTRTSATSVDEPAVVVWSNPPDVTSDTITGNENVCGGTAPSLDITGSATAYVLADINRGGAVTPQTPQPITYVWQKSTDLSTWTVIPGATGQSLTSAEIGTLNVTTYFQRVIGADFCTGGTIVTKTVTNVASPNGSEGSGGVICRSNPINLSVTGAGGAVFNWTGPNSFTATGPTQTINNAQIIDGGNYIVTQTVGGCVSPPDTVAANIVNCAPTSTNDAFSANEDVTINGDIGSNDSDPDTDPLTYAVLNGGTAAANGTITLSPAGVLTYVPNANFNGVVSFTYTACDNGVPAPVLCDTATVTFTITAVNDAPVAVDDINSTNEDAPVNGTAATNDSDIDGPSANYTPVTNPANGGVVVNANGTYTYTPNANFNGVDSFTYSLCDGGTPDLCDTATVVITVNPVNDAPVAVDDVNSTANNTPVNGTVVTNDSDIDGPAANYTVATNPANGSVTVNPNGTYTYTPNGAFGGVDSFTYSLCDGGTPDLCDTAIVVITVSAVNTPPIVTNDVNTTPEDTPVSGTVLTGGDSDPDGTTLTANTTPVSGPSHGTIIVNANGTYTYTPAANFNGTDIIVISVCDNGIPLPAICENDTLTITVTPVNDAPVAVDDSKTTAEDTPVNGTVATNDSDIDGPSANYTVNTNPTQGTVVLNANGTYTYTPSANYNGSDAFTYILCDAGTPNLCDTATVFIQVTPVNDPPLLINDIIGTPEDTAFTGSVATNDNPTDGPFALYQPGVSPAHGTLSFNFNGNFTYTPNANFYGTDSFTYIVCDGGSPNLCDTATVYIFVTAVNDAPVANNDNNTTPVNTPVSGTVKTNDTDPDGPAAIYTLTAPPLHGTVVLNGNGTYTYTPDSGYVGCDTMYVALCDSGVPNLCSTSSLVICITSSNHAPDAIDDYTRTLINTNVTVNVLINDLDVDSNLSNAPTILSGPSHGTVTVNGDGTITYTPATDFIGADTFSYIICDQGMPVMCDTAMMFITVISPPVINGTPLITQTDSAISTCFTYTITMDTVDLVASVSCNPQHGTVSVTLNTATQQLCITYTPDSGYYGLDTFCIRLCDTVTGLCATGAIPVTVNSKNTTCYWLKGISPNGDGQNDDFYINCNDSYPNAALKVFNRWGDQVWDSQGHYTNNFEGNNGRGDILPDGTYYYIYYYNDGSGGQHAGFIQVSR